MLCSRLRAHGIVRSRWRGRVDGGEELAITDYPRKVMAFADEDAVLAFVYQKHFGRRSMTGAAAAQYRDWRDGRILALHQLRWNGPEIGAEVGCSEDTVYDVLRSFGISLSRKIKQRNDEIRRRAAEVGCGKTTVYDVLGGVSDSGGGKTNQRDEEIRRRAAAGEQRYRAALRAGLATVPVIVRDDISESEVEKIRIHENLMRRGLKPSDQARGIQRLYELHGIERGRPDGEKISPRNLSSVADQIGWRVQKVGIYHTLSNLIEPLQERWDAGEITRDTAYQIAQLSADEQGAIAVLYADAGTVPILRAGQDAGP
jgi:hypothetical protein